MSLSHSKKHTNRVEEPDLSLAASFKFVTLGVAGASFFIGKQRKEEVEDEEEEGKEGIEEEEEEQ